MPEPDWVPGSRVIRIDAKLRSVRSISQPPKAVLVASDADGSG